MGFKEYLDKRLNENIKDMNIAGFQSNKPGEKMSDDQYFLYRLVWFMFEAGSYQGWMDVKDLTSPETFAEYEEFMNTFAPRVRKRYQKVLEKLVSLKILQIKTMKQYVDDDEFKVITFTKKGASLPARFMNDPETVTNYPRDLEYN